MYATYCVLLSPVWSIPPLHPGLLTSLLTKTTFEQGPGCQSAHPPQISSSSDIPITNAPSIPLSLPHPPFYPKTERILHLVQQRRGPDYTMDTTRQAIEDADLSKLNDKDKGELRQFLALESKRSEVQASMSCLQFPQHTKTIGSWSWSGDLVRCGSL